jgi:hypothetical protein
MGTAMSASLYREYAADCVVQAQSEITAAERNIILNVALAWLRLAQQSETHDEAWSPPLAPRPFDLDELAFIHKIAS